MFSCVFTNLLVSYTLTHSNVPFLPTHLFCRRTGQEDMHSPPETSDLESECCRTNCYNEMKKAGTTCPDGKVLRMDGHDPTMGDMRPMMEQCCMPD